MSDEKERERLIKLPVRYDEAGIIVDRNGLNVLTVFGWSRMPPSLSKELGYYICEVINSHEQLQTQAAAKTGCPCLIADNPCHPQCTCVTPEMSRGCQCCARYGSPEQRKANANRLVALSNQAAAIEAAIAGAEAGMLEERKMHVRFIEPPTFDQRDFTFLGFEQGYKACLAKVSVRGAYARKRGTDVYGNKRGKNGK